MKNYFLLSFISLIVFACNNQSNNSSANATSKDSISSAFKPTLLLNLPDSCNTPDGLTVLSGDTFLVSMPNFNKPQFTPRIYKVIGNSITPFVDLPVHPETKHLCPMDLAFGPDGNLYISDNQYELYDKNYKSRILKVIVKAGKPVSVIPIVTGLRLANGMVWKGNDLYVTDSKWDMPNDTAKSAVFHFTAAQLSGSAVQLKPGFNNQYILDTFTTHISDDKIDNGVDGIDYDSKGNLFTGTFADGILYKLSLNKDGSLARKEVFVPGGHIASVDGFIIDRKTDNLYVADAKKNAIRVVTPEGKVSTLWQNQDTDGRDGLLDQPAEVLLINNKLYITNFDRANGHSFINKGYNPPNTISVINLK